MTTSTEYRLSAWIKQGKDGGKFMSIALTPKEQQQQKPVPSSAGRFIDDQHDDSIQF